MKKITYKMRGEISRVKKLQNYHQVNMANHQWMTFLIPFELAWKSSIKKFFKC